MWIRFEAGTPAIGEAIGLGAAIDYLSTIGMQKIHAYEVKWIICSIIVIQERHNTTLWGRNMLLSLTIGVALFSRVLMKWVPCSSLKYQLGPILRFAIYAKQLLFETECISRGLFNPQKGSKQNLMDLVDILTKLRDLFNETPFHSVAHICFLILLSQRTRILYKEFIFM